MNRRRHNPGKQRGITTAEAVVFLAMAMLVLAVLVPTVQSHRAMSRLIEARQQTRQIADAVERCYADTRLAHLFGEHRSINVLIGPGAEPSDHGYTPTRNWYHGRTMDLQIALTQPPMCDCDAATTWRGAYLTNELKPDPWGCRYLINIGELKPGSDAAHAVFVISAGPNRIIDTPFTQTRTSAMVGGDDIAWRVR